MEDPERRSEAEILCGIRPDTIEIQCSLNKDVTPETYPAFLECVVLMADAPVSLLTFNTGVGFSYVLEKCILPDGTTIGVVQVNPLVENLATTASTDDLFGNCLGLMVEDPELTLALRDLAPRACTHKPTAKC